MTCWMDFYGKIHFYVSVCLLRAIPLLPAVWEMMVDQDGTGLCLVVKVKVGANNPSTHTRHSWLNFSAVFSFISFVCACIILNHTALYCLFVHMCTSPAPCGSRSTGSEGTVLSPNFPRNYTSGQTCVYSISVPREFGKLIHSQYMPVQTSICIQ